MSACVVVLSGYPMFRRFLLGSTVTAGATRIEKPRFLPSAVNLFLVVLILGAFIFAWQMGQSRKRLDAEYQRLARVTGDLTIEDASKVHVQAIDCVEPFHFSWRVYLPADRTWIVETGPRGNTRAWIAQGEFLAHAQFRVDKLRNVTVYIDFGGGSTEWYLCDQFLTELLEDQWNRIHIETVGTSVIEAIEPGEFIIILRLSFPKDLKSEARRKLRGWSRDLVVPDFFEVRLKPI